MSRYGKYAMTKKVAMALQAMVRGQFAQDSLQLVGFYTYANVMTEKQLLSSAPKQVSIYDSRVHLRFSLDDPPKRVPEHFTNIHAGLRLQRSLLVAWHYGGNEQADHRALPYGEPTAHIEGREVVLIYPLAEKTAHAHARRGQEVRGGRNPCVSRKASRLIEDYFYLGLVNFVEEMARVSQGVAAYCGADDLGKYVIDSFVSGRRSRKMTH